MSESQCRAVAARHFPQSELIRWQRLTGGVSADVFRLDLRSGQSQRTVVLRIHGSRHGGHEAQLEFDVLKAVHASGIPAAEPIAVDTTRHVIQEDYLLLEFVAGSTQVAQAEVAHILQAMASQLKQIHATAFGDFPRLPRREQPFPAAYEWLQEERWAGLVALIQTIETSFSGSSVLLHGDFWPENIMWQDQQIVAVLDWEDAAIGDPLSDLAGCCVELSYIYGDHVVEPFLDAYGVALGDRTRFCLWQIHVASAAAFYMSQWGLPPEKEAHMRKVAHATIENAWATLKTSHNL